MSTVEHVPTTPVSLLPVITDFAAARTPKGSIASRLFGEAEAIRYNVSNPVDDATAKANRKNGALRTMSTSRDDTFYLNPYLVEIRDSWNCRDLFDPSNQAHIDYLARSIAEVGVLETMSVAFFVKPDGSKAIGVTNGHMRLLATLRAIEVYGAEIKAIPLKLESKNTDEADHILGQITRNSGKAPTVMEMANVFKKLAAFQWSNEQIGQRSGLGATRVAQILAFAATASPEIKSLISSGAVAATLAAETLRDSGNDTAGTERTLTAAVEIARKQGKTRATKRHVEAAAAGDTVAKPSFKTMLRDVLKGRTSTVETSGKVTTITMSTADWKRLNAVLKIGE